MFSCSQESHRLQGQGGDAWCGTLAANRDTCCLSGVCVPQPHSPSRVSAASPLTTLGPTVVLQWRSRRGVCMAVMPGLHSQSSVLHNHHQLCEEQAEGKRCCFSCRFGSMWGNPKSWPPPVSVVSSKTALPAPVTTASHFAYSAGSCVCVCSGLTETEPCSPQKGDSGEATRYICAVDVLCLIPSASRYFAFCWSTDLHWVKASTEDGKQVRSRDDLLNKSMAQAGGESAVCSRETIQNTRCLVVNTERDCVTLWNTDEKTHLAS